MTDKIIFLDFDGVLNPMMNMHFLHSIWKKSDGEIKSRDYYGQLFFDQSVEALKKIIDETQAKIVVSSTWRLSGLQNMVAMWKHRNMPGEIIDVTPNENEVVASGKAEFYDMVCRGMEIDHWIQENKFEGKYVIIDDTPDMLESQAPFFVLTNSDFGLTNANAELTIKILNA